jgi:hypothetical protein
MSQAKLSFVVHFVVIAGVVLLLTACPGSSASNSRREDKASFYLE